MYLRSDKQEKFRYALRLIAEAQRWVREVRMPADTMSMELDAGLCQAKAILEDYVGRR